MDIGRLTARDEEAHGDQGQRKAAAQAASPRIAAMAGTSTTHAMSVPTNGGSNALAIGIWTAKTSSTPANTHAAAWATNTQIAIGGCTHKEGQQRK